MRSCFGTKLQCDVKFVLVRSRGQKKALLPEVADDEAERALQFELNNWSAITGTEGVVYDNCVRDVVVGYALK